MSKGFVVAAMVVLSVATTGLWSLPFAHAGQSLGETMNSVGIAGEQHGKSGSNVLGAANKARAVAQMANKARGDDPVWEDAGPFKPARTSSSGQSQAAPSNAHYVTGKNLTKAFAGGGDGALKAMVGQVGTVRGQVAEILQPEGQTFVIVREAGVGKEGPAFMFRYNGKPTLPFKVGDSVELTGKFALRHEEPETGVTFVYDVEGQAGEQTANAEPADMYNGWRFMGSVRTGSGTTGVFVHGDSQDAVYAKAGKKLADGVVVTHVGFGEAKLKVGERTLAIIP